MKEISEHKIKTKGIQASRVDWEKEFCKWNMCLFILSTESFTNLKKTLTVNCAILDTDRKQTVLQCGSS